MLLINRVSTQRLQQILSNQKADIFSALIAIVGYLALSLCGLVLLMPITSYGMQAPLVEVSNVKAWNNGAAHQMHCIVESPDLYQVASHTNARLSWSLPEGTQVNKGQIVAKQDSYYIEREIEQLKIDIAIATAQDDFTEKELARLSLLNTKQLVSASHFNELSNQAKQAELAKQLLNAQLKELRYRHKHLVHIAAEDGEVLKRQANNGENLQDGQQILQLLPTSKKELMCELPLQKYRQSQQLQNVSFIHADKGVFTLARISKALDERSQTVTLYLKGEQTVQQQMLIGERVNIIASYQNTVLTRVPLDALELSEDASYVWAVGEGSTVKKIPVEIIETQQAYFLVKSNLVVGDNVVTIGKQGLKNEQLVRTINTSLNTTESTASIQGASL